MSHNYIEERPWGKFEILLDAPNCKVKKLTLNPRGKLSLQSHKHRNEHWIVITGKATVTNGEKEIILEKKESVFIPVSNKHRMENKGEEILEVIEVQTGSYFGEDDEIRYADVYGRIRNN